MKSNWIFPVLVLLSRVITAQDYQICFAVKGADESIIDSVVIHNINQNHMITLQGDDTLHLTGSVTGRTNLKIPDNGLEVYPNPFTKAASIVFQNETQGPVQISLFDMAGKIVVQKRMDQAGAKTMAEISGLPAGAYVIQIGTEVSIFSRVILSNGGSGNHPEINFKGSVEDISLPEKALKSSKRTGEMVDMQYNEGDTLMISAYLGNLNSEIKIVPFASTTISFDFRPNQENISASADITVEGGDLQVVDESGNIVKLTFPPGAVVDSTTVTLTLWGEYKNLPIHERHLRTFELGPLDLKLYRPVEISIEYHSVIDEIEQTALFYMHSESYMTPLGNHTHSDDKRTITASCYIPGDFAEGRMTLDQVNSQFDQLISHLGISWENIMKSNQAINRPMFDGGLSKAIWDEWRLDATGLLKLMDLRLRMGYYDELEEGKPTFEEELALLCKNVINRGVQEVLDLGLPEDPCDRDYTLTIASMLQDMMLMGCDKNSEYDRLLKRFEEMLVDCKSYLSIFSEVNIQSGGLVISTSGVVPLTLSAISADRGTVSGVGTLEVTGKGDGGADCKATISGVTAVDVYGNRDDAYTYVLTLETFQDAMMTTVCPHGTNETPLTGSGSREVTLSRSNNYTVNIEEGIDGGTFKMDITLFSPYASIPIKE